MFNAGRGSVLTSEGRVGWTASIRAAPALRAGPRVEGGERRAPYSGPRAGVVMEDTPHLLLGGGAP